MSARFMLTPRELAEALGVSESSIKRWADEGTMTVARTAGGHRRIALEEAIRFARESRLRLVRPEALGLDDLVLLGGVEVNATECADRLFELLRTGAAGQARGLILAWYLEGRAVADILDGAMRGAMQRVGELWQHSADGVFLEHRATDILIQAMAQLRMLMTAPPAGSPVAVGGAPAGDPYALPSLGAATVLAAAGFTATNLGPETPASALGEAIASLRPRLAWLSVSTQEAAERLRGELARLLATVEECDTYLALGGRAVSAVGAVGAAGEIAHARLVRVATMAELEAFARGMLTNVSTVAGAAG